MKVSEIDNMAFESLLYDFYGVLLTDKQREVMELYHEENYSIVEIARELKVSKQAVYDNLKKSDRILREYEAKLGLMLSLLKSRELIGSVQDRIDELKQKGVTFYLDDFGTGYSNMERILELPFDIIKFDRSMVVAAGESEKSLQVLGSLADLFSKQNYSVLYEGVEDEKDEQMCLALNASYLQGYKYSKPIPISELRNYLTKA